MTPERNQMPPRIERGKPANEMTNVRVNIRNDLFATLVQDAQDLSLTRLFNSLLDVALKHNLHSEIIASARSAPTNVHSVVKTSR